MYLLKITNQNRILNLFLNDLEKHQYKEARSQVSACLTQR